MGEIFEKTFIKVIITLIIIWLIIGIFSKIYISIERKKREKIINQEMQNLIGNNYYTNETYIFHAEGI